jgi:hypothetical protein
MIDDDWAGSCRIAASRNGMPAPERPAATMESIMAIPQTRVNPAQRLQFYRLVDIPFAREQRKVSVFYPQGFQP